MIHCWTLGLQIRAPQRCQAPVNQRLTPCLAQKKPFVCRYHPFAGPYDGGFFGICINRLSFLNHQSWHRRRMSRRSCSCCRRWQLRSHQTHRASTLSIQVFEARVLVNEPESLKWSNCCFLQVTLLLTYHDWGVEIILKLAKASFQPFSLCTFNHQATLQTSADLNFFAKKHRFGVRLTGLVILQELFKIYLRHGLKAWRSGWVGGDWSPPWVFCPTKIRGRIRRAVWSNWSAHSVLPICWMMGRPGCAPVFW